MEKEVNLLEKSQRLRYEAFSVFAAHINKANDIATIGEQLTSQIKFIIDGFILQILHVFEEEKLCLEVYRGICTITENPAEPITAFHDEQLLKAIPLALSRQQLLADHRLARSVFNHEKTVSFYALPIVIHARHQIMVAIANKENSLYTEVDFRFLRLICDLLSSKLSQLSLLKNIEKKNQALAQANDSLANANEELLTLNEKIGLLNQHLEKKVEERTYELKHANEELQTIFYRTSHDFRRPLTSILGLVHVAELTVKEAEVLGLLGHCKSVVREMDAMLTKLSILSATENPSITLQLIDFDEIILQIKEKFRDKITQAHIQFECSAELNQPFYSDAGTLLAIIENLVENAIYFCASKPYIRLSIVESPAAINISVTDNGQGIEEEHLDKIFNMYYRANDQSKGNGLGLYVVKKLVKRLNGEVTVESKQGEGSTFIIVLPALGGVEFRV
jgi:signal transduction histidine kinase